jgi:uncharacterized protein (DUF1786 family)
LYEDGRIAQFIIRIVQGGNGVGVVYEQCGHGMILHEEIDCADTRHYTHTL